MTLSSRPLTLAVLLCAALVAAPACNRDESDDVSVAQEGLDSTDLVGAESGILSASLDGAAAVLQLRAPPTPEAVAAAAAARLEAVMSPAGCFTSSITGASATYTFADCSGPRGLLHLTGTVTVEYAVTVAQISATATASDLHVNGATLDVTADAVFTVSAGTRHLQVTTVGSGTGPRGHALTRDGSYTLSWADECFTLDGTWTRTGDRGTASTVVAGLARCQGSCPTAGSITHTGVLGRTVSVSFDGSDAAAWSTSGGRGGTVELLCTPAA